MPNIINILMPNIINILIIDYKYHFPFMLHKYSSIDLVNMVLILTYILIGMSVIYVLIVYDQVVRQERSREPQFGLMHS